MKIVQTVGPLFLSRLCGGEEVLSIAAAVCFFLSRLCGGEVRLK